MSSAARSTLANVNLAYVRDTDLPFETARKIIAFAADLAPESVAPQLAGLELYEEHGRMNEAGPWIDAGLRSHPHDLGLLKARVRVYQLEGETDLALTYWNRVVALDPASDPLGEATANLYLTLGRLDEAIPRFAKIVQHMLGDGRSDAEARIAFQQYGDALLRSGDPNGFLHFINIIDSPYGAYIDVPGIPWWAGHDVRGKRLLITHQLGFGDQFLLLAVVPYLRTQDCEVFVTADLAVCELLSPIFGSKYILPCIRPFGPAAPASPELLDFCDRIQPDLQATLYHLPEIAIKCGAKAHDLFAPYIVTPQQTALVLREELQNIRLQAGGRTIVGIAWDCVQRNFSHEHGIDAACYARNRSVPTKTIAALTDDPAIADKYYFVSLVEPSHYEHFSQELPINMEHARHLKKCFSQTAALIEFCDFVISIDTSIANLSAVQGQETWVLLHQRVDWRYGLVGDTSPWLPTMKLFRQRVPGDWTGVMHETREALLARATPAVLPCVTDTIDTFGGEPIHAVLEALALLTPYDIDIPKRRIGPEGDGGYVLAGNISPAQSVISFGVGAEYRFEASMAEAGHKVYMFDHTIDDIQAVNSNMVWKKEGVSGESDVEQSLYTISDHLERYEIRGNRLIMKMDVEGAEFDAIAETSDDVLARFEQIGIEIHFLARLNEAAFRERFKRMLRKLNHQFTLFHVHANNCDGPNAIHMIAGFPVSNVIELSYIRSAMVLRSKSKTLYPTEYDHPNVPFKEKLLWFFPFMPTTCEPDDFMRCDERAESQVQWVPA
jgi:tetratricopeptide (TPR) repeat protein